MKIVIEIVFADKRSPQRDAEIRRMLQELREETELVGGEIITVDQRENTERLAPAASQD